MNQSQKSLATLRSEFKGFPQRAGNALFVQHPRGIGIETIREKLPELFSAGRFCGGVYSDKRELRRSYQSLFRDEACAAEFGGLAESAGNCVGSWCPVPVAAETIARQNTEQRWLYTLFDLAAADRLPPRIKFDRRFVANREIAVYEWRLLCPGSEYDAAELYKAIHECKSQGFYIHLKDLFRASVCAIDWLLPEVDAEPVTQIGNTEEAPKRVGTLAREQSTKPTDPTSKSEQRIQWLTQAMLLVLDHPYWSDADIAMRVGKNKSTLSRSKQYQAAAARARGVKDDRHRGHISVDPDSGLRDVEACSDDPAERDWDD